MKEQPIHRHYEEARVQLAHIIMLIDRLYLEEKELGGQIAQWGLTFTHEDLVKIFHRLGNLKLTTRKKSPKKRVKKK